MPPRAQSSRYNILVVAHTDPVRTGGKRTATRFSCIWTTLSFASEILIMLLVIFVDGEFSHRRRVNVTGTSMYELQVSLRNVVWVKYKLRLVSIAIAIA